MNQKLFLSICLVLSLAANGATAQTFHATLRGSAETPNPGDPDGGGTATVALSPDRTQAFIDVTVFDIGVNITASHIHTGKAGVAGAPLISISTPNENFANGRISVVRSLTVAEANEIAANPAAFYVNIHTAEFPSGAIRGQLSPAAYPLRTTMLGAGEVPGPGDLDGLGTTEIVFDANRTKAFVTISVSNISTITGAHIHQGMVGASISLGPPVVDFPITFSSGTPLKITHPIDPDLAAAILSNPVVFYINIHSTEFPGGAIRGQLGPSRPSGDSDGSGDVSVADVFYLINFLFGSGSAPR